MLKLNLLMIRSESVWLLLIFLLFGINAFSQRTVSGLVTDGQYPLPGVNVIVEGTSQGVVTDFDGNYSINGVNDNAILVFSYLGFISQKVTVGALASLDIQLKEDIQGLEEVVVTGYGTQKKATLTGSIATIGGAALEKSISPNLGTALAGKVAGLFIDIGNGAPGNEATAIRIRGTNTFNNSNALLVIDGIPNRAGGLNRINPADIESVSVLKDASAAIYGARAANGVILITTKRGKKGTPKVKITSNYGWQNFTTVPDMLTGAEYMDLVNKLQQNKGGFYAAIDADNSQGEGRYYLWTKNELITTLGKELPWFTSYYDIDFKDPFEEEFYHLRQGSSDAEFLKAHELSAKTLGNLKFRWQQQLKAVRKTKAFPRIDDKILTSWNALAVVGLTEGYEAFNDSKFLDTAIEVFDFIRLNSIQNGSLFHTYQKGKPKIKGFLEDHAHLIKAALKLYKNTLDTGYLEFALSLTERTLKKFSDPESPFFTYKENQPLLSKIIAVDDGVLPSSNAVMADNLWTLGQLMDRKDLNQRATEMLNAIQPFLVEGRSNYAYWTQVIAKQLDPHFEVVVVGPKAKTLGAKINSHYLPNILFQASKTANDLPLLKDRFYPEETYIYVCKNKVCLRPVKTVDKALAQIKNWK